MLQLVDFVVTNMPKYKGQERRVEQILRLHKEYDTLDFEEDDSGVVYVMRYNVGYTTADVLDLVVRDSNKKLSFLKYIIGKNWIRHPYLRSFCFERASRDWDKGYREIKLEELFKKRGNHGRVKNTSRTADTTATSFSRAIGQRVCSSFADDIRDSATVSAAV